MTQTCNGPPRWGGADGPKIVVSSPANVQPHSPIQATAQEKKSARLRLVTAAQPPRPRRLEVRIAASDGRVPIGRTRPLRLSRDDLDWLIDEAVRREAVR